MGLEKFKIGAKTNEDVFGIVAEPEYHRQYIKDCVDNRNRYYRFLKRDMEDDEATQEVVSNVLWNVDTMIDSINMDEISDKMDELRDWGQEWKDLAIQLFERLAADIQKEIIDYQNLK